MANFREYSVPGAERWDTVSNENYGTPYEAARIQAANTGVVLGLTVPAGTVLCVPELPADLTEVSADKLPPWRR